MSSNNKYKTILHIGYPKTGTTWFQKNYFPFVKGVSFYSHTTIQELIGTNNDRLDENKAKKNIALAQKKGHLVISDESLLQGPKKMEASALYHKHVFEDATVILFIRNQVKKYASNYSEYIKAGGTKTFANFLIKPNGEYNGGEKHCYDKTLDIYYSIFGRENVFIYLYEDFEDNPVKFIQEFTKKHMLDIDLEQINFKRVNRSLPRKLIQLKRILNKFTKRQTGWVALKTRKDYIFHIPLWYEITHILFKQLSKIGFRSKGILSTKDKAMVADFFRESNRRLMEDYGFEEIKRYNYPV